MEEGVPNVMIHRQMFQSLTDGRTDGHCLHIKRSLLRKERLRDSSVIPLT